MAICESTQCPAVARWPADSAAFWLVSGVCIGSWPPVCVALSRVFARIASALHELAPIGTGVHLHSEITELYKIDAFQPSFTIQLTGLLTKNKRDAVRLLYGTEISFSQSHIP